MATATCVETITTVNYNRVSTTPQAGERHVSLEVQGDAYGYYCQVNHRADLGTFVDVATGKKNNRPQYQAMLEFVDANNVDEVVVLWLDRFGRRPQEILTRYWGLKDHGTKVVSLKEDLEEELMLLLRAGIAGQDSKRTSERVTMALQKAAEKGSLVNKLPFGLVKIYDSDGKVDHVEQVPQEAAVVREASHLAVNDNKGYKAIADVLNTRGHRTKKGNLWATQTVKLLLTNPAIAGHMVFRGAIETVEHRDVYPAILNPHEWDRLQERLAIRRDSQRGKASTSDYLLSGIARCGRCGGAISGSSKGPGKPRQYVCANWKMSRARCEGNTHHREPLEEAVLNYLGQYSDPDVVRELLEAQGQETDIRDETELRRVTKRLAELEKAFLNDLDRVDRGIITEAEFVKRQEVRRGEQEGLHALKADLEARVAAQRDMESQVAAVPVMVKSFLEDFRDMDVRQAKAILQGIIKAAHVYNDGRIELEFR